MTKEIILNKVSDILKNDLEISAKQITPELTFEDLYLNSITLMQLYVLIEELFEIEFEDELIGSNKFLKISDIIDYIYEKKKME